MISRVLYLQIKFLSQTKDWQDTSLFQNAIIQIRVFVRSTNHLCTRQVDESDPIQGRMDRTHIIHFMFIFPRELSYRFQYTFLNILHRKMRLSNCSRTSIDPSMPLLLRKSFPQHILKYFFFQKTLG